MAADGIAADLAFPVPRRRVRNSTPTKKARSWRSEGLTTGWAEARASFRLASLESSPRNKGLSSSFSAGRGIGQGHLDGRRCRGRLRFDVPVRRPPHDNRRYGVFENQLFLVTRFEDD